VATVAMVAVATMVVTTMVVATEVAVRVVLREEVAMAAEAGRWRCRGR